MQISKNKTKLREVDQFAQGCKDSKSQRWDSNSGPNSKPVLISVLLGVNNKNWVIRVWDTGANWRMATPSKLPVPGPCRNIDQPGKSFRLCKGS